MWNCLQNVQLSAKCGTVCKMWNCPQNAELSPKCGNVHKMWNCPQNAEMSTKMWNLPQIIQIIYCLYTIPFKMKKVVINQDKPFQKCAKDYFKFYFHHIQRGARTVILGPFPHSIKI